MKRDFFCKSRHIDPLDLDGMTKKQLEAIVSAGKSSFQGREALQCADLWWEVLHKKATIWFSVGGAPIPSGLGKVFALLARYRFVDVIVSVGSQIFHDLHCAIGEGYFGHDSKGDSFDDENLRDVYANRYHNVISSDICERRTGHWARDVWKENLEQGRRYSSRELIRILFRKAWGREDCRKEQSFVVNALQRAVEIIVPTLHDSWLGCELVNLRRGIYDKIVDGKIVMEIGEKFNFIYDALKDVEEASEITSLSDDAAIIIFGGGMSRNFTQQSAFICNLSAEEGKEKNFSYALKFSGDKASLGGLSGSTLTECVAWGKYNKGAKMASCDGDATFTVPVAIASILLRMRKNNFHRSHPVFCWRDDPLSPLSISYV